MNWNTRVTELLKIKYPIIQGALPILPIQIWLPLFRMQEV